MFWAAEDFSDRIGALVHASRSESCEEQRMSHSTSEPVDYISFRLESPFCLRVLCVSFSMCVYVYKTYEYSVPNPTFFRCAYLSKPAINFLVLDALSHKEKSTNPNLHILLYGIQCYRHQLPCHSVLLMLYLSCLRDETHLETRNSCTLYYRAPGERIEGDIAILFILSLRSLPKRSVFDRRFCDSQELLWETSYVGSICDMRCHTGYIELRL
nr:hypothetical protein CFP56_65538 [Quercus suber]